MASPDKKAFLLRIDPALWAEIERLAAAELRSANAEVEYLLREALRPAASPQAPSSHPEGDSVGVGPSLPEGGVGEGAALSREARIERLEPLDARDALWAWIDSKFSTSTRSARCAHRRSARSATSRTRSSTNFGFS